MRISPAPLWAASFAIVFLIAHLFFLPSTLEDIDSLNFALGIHDFDPSKHQPHPPGYPVFIALAKVARAVAPSDAKALALLGALFGAVAVFPLLSLYKNLDALEGRPRSTAALAARLAAALAMASPLYWFNAGRPMSDIPGLAVILAAQAALVAAFVRQRLNPARTPEAVADSGRMIVLGAFLSGLALGMRSQALWLTLPLLVVVLLQRAGRGAAGALLGSVMTFTIGGLIWAVPLVVASGGPAAYRAAVSAQGAEDFAGVDMLYTNPSARRLALSLMETFIYPWASPVLGWAIFALATAGALALLRRAPRVLALLAVLAVPYLILHLLVHETLTTRYALPLIPVMAYAAVKGIEAIGGTGTIRPAYATVVVAMLVIWSLVLTLPAVRVYARDGSPAFAAVAELHRRLQSEPRATVALHQGLARSVRTQDLGSARVLPAPPMREWLELAKYWLAGNTAPVWFLADPARTDIDLIDPLSRTTIGRYAWHFPRDRFISGVRPDVVDLIRIDSPPGWFAEDGWHLTPETLNRSEQLGRSAGVAYIRSRADAALLVVGGESTGEAAHVRLTLDDQEIAEWDIPAKGTFFERVVLVPGTLAGAGVFRRLVASYASAAGGPQTLRLSQLAIASRDEVFFVRRSGWNELEYSRALQRRWQWTTGRAETFINSGGRDVTVTLSGESPLRSFDSAPTVVVRVGALVLATASPADDFELTILVPAPALAAADGILTIETDKTFVPHERTGSPDLRTLGLRVFTFDVR